MALDAYSIDYAQSALIYRLSYLNPLYRYRIHATVYHQDPVPLLEEFAFPVDSTTTMPGTVVTAPPSAPVEVWFDVPPQLYRDGATDLVIRKLAGGYAAVAAIDLHESEPEGSGTGSGGQSSGSAALRHPPAILGVVPNPFSRTVTIRYQLFDAGTASLRILDISGRSVRVVRSRETGSECPGVRTVAWDGLDGVGNAMPAGIYFCQLEAGGVHSTVKLCLTR
jgi:hypothetical protein